MEQPTHAEQIRAIRDLQREAASTGRPLSFSDARDVLRERAAEKKDDPNAKSAAMSVEIAALKAELSALRSEMIGMRVTGVGFSGEGPNGIMFKAEELESSASAIAVKDEGVTLTTAARCIDIVGPTVEATNSSGNVTLTVTPLAVKEEGSDVVSAATGCTSIDVKGGALTATATGQAATVTYRFFLYEDASEKEDDCYSINFTGDVTVTSTDGEATVNIPGALPEIVLTLAKNGIPTDYTINGEEAEA